MRRYLVGLCRESVIHELGEGSVENMCENVCERRRLDEIRRLIEQAPQGRRDTQIFRRTQLLGRRRRITRDAALSQDEIFISDRWEEKVEPLLIAALLFRRPLDALPNRQRELCEFLEAELVARCVGAEDLLHGFFHFGANVGPAAVQEPPAERQVFAVRLEVVAIVLLHVVVVAVFKADFAAFLRWGGEEDDAREVVPAAEEVELYAGEEGEEAEGVD